MTTDTELRVSGLRALLDALGPVDAERFIALVQREPFDYTEWQRQLWTDKDVDELSKAAMEWRARGAEQASDYTSTNKD